MIRCYPPLFLTWQGICISLAMVFGGWHEVNTPPDLTRPEAAMQRLMLAVFFDSCRAWNDTALFLSEEDTVTQVKVPLPGGWLPSTSVWAPMTFLPGHGCVPPQRGQRPEKAASHCCKGLWRGVKGGREEGQNHTESWREMVGCPVLAL